MNIYQFESRGSAETFDKDLYNHVLGALYKAEDIENLGESGEQYFQSQKESYLHSKHISPEIDNTPNEEAEREYVRRMMKLYIDFNTKLGCENYEDFATYIATQLGKATTNVVALRTMLEDKIEVKPEAKPEDFKMAA